MVPVGSEKKFTKMARLNNDTVKKTRWRSFDWEANKGAKTRGATPEGGGVMSGGGEEG